MQALEQQILNDDKKILDVEKSKNEANDAYKAQLGKLKQERRKAIQPKRDRCMTLRDELKVLRNNKNYILHQEPTV